ncbi:MAG: isoleucine--tRNA ligase [Dehalococcoidia bacterium]|nr:isoleucine--tRNA ligase [Dehalococcoidia bacterium]
MFRPVPSKTSFPELEKRILHFWREKRIFERSVTERETSPLFVLYEGPPTANASPGVHHILSRVFKDVIPRYKTMRGYCAPRKAGWDTHGLPVELEIERELGFSSKDQIETYGVSQFNARCRESVFRYQREWEEVTERIGFWLDMEHPYVTLDNDYIESCWWVIKQLWEKGLIYQGYKVTPHCPRCGTSLSSHEVALGYEDNTPDPSVWIKFKLKLGSVGGTPLERHLPLLQKKSATYLLAWTTTPWTLPGNTALAVAPDADYSVMEGENDHLIMASALVNMVGLEGYHEVVRVKGEEIAGVQKGLRYEPLFNPHQYGVERRRFRQYKGEAGIWRMALEIQPEDKDLSFPVIDTDFVSLDEGTGIVHIAPAFGEADYEAGEDNDLDFVQPVDLQGNITGTYPFARIFVKEADDLILKELGKDEKLYRRETIRHTYPFCWRCATPLLYYAKPSWYIKTTAKKDRLIAGNEEINWYPEHIKRGRFGDWLENNVDWAFSRERYWGTPLPIWRCEGCGKDDCIGSLDELKGKPGLSAESMVLDALKKGEADLHRPYIDTVLFNCSECEGGKMRRLPDVLDAWFDSGAMPVAQWHYPFENKEIFEKFFPADYICEAVDQTRGWFYTLHALSTLLFDRPCFRNVICLGHILDAKGEKMSKSKGNVVDPWTVLDSQGADALRWYLLTSSPAGSVRRFSAELVGEAQRRFIRTLWNTYSFFVTYANIDKFDPRAILGVSEFSERAELDRWIISELQKLIVDVIDAMEGYNPTDAGRRIQGFVEDLSNWYVRRSRRRFWKSESDADKLSAYATLYECLVTLAKLLAPLTPFVAEEFYQNLVRPFFPDEPESVHLAQFPIDDPTKVDEQLAQDTRLAMTVASLGRAKRSEAGIKVRQPLDEVIVGARSRGEKESLERMRSQILDELNVKKLRVDVIISAPTANATAQALPPSVTVELNTNIDQKLADEGMARELVHRLQTMRKQAGFDIADYIYTYYQGGESLKRVIENKIHADYIKQETLSREVIAGIPRDAYTESHKIAGEEITLGVKRQG